MLDYAKIKIQAGNGGKGLVSFRREKYVPKGGPNGGDGGKGGNVFIIASNEVATLLDFQYLNHFEAPSGEAGGTSDKRGKDGNDLVIKVPVGSIIKLNKLVADIPHKKRKKSQYEEPIEYTQKMFNYKKMHKLKMRALTEENQNSEKAEEPIDQEDMQIEQENGTEQFVNIPESTDLSELDQIESYDEETDASEIVRNISEEHSSPSHKLYKFSEREQPFAKALRTEKAEQRLTSDEIPTFDLDKEGEKITIARGGQGGRGNARFKWSQNQAPQFAEPGQKGEYVEIEIILKMVANVGIIGFPNAGKSTLLSKLTAASPKIANYPFTTLEPNLGVTYIDEKPLVLADIPGLIEGASQGKGLGYKFLQHVERTQILLHVIEIPDLAQVSSIEDLTATIIQSYNTIRNELLEYGNNLSEKLEIIVINKIDRIPEENRKEYIEPLEAELRKLGKPYVFVSAENELGLNGLKKIIQTTLVEHQQ